MTSNQAGVETINTPTNNSAAAIAEQLHSHIALCDIAQALELFSELLNRETTVLKRKLHLPSSKPLGNKHVTSSKLRRAKLHATLC